VASLCFATGCYHYYVKPDRVAPATEWRSETQVALFWGLMQPEDIAPPNCPPGVALAEVNANTNLGYVLIGTVTLGIVLPQELAWRCAKLPPVAEDPDEVQLPRPVRGKEALHARAVPAH
jgi:Bor protein